MNNRFREVGLFGIKPTGQPHLANYLCLNSTIKRDSLMLCFIADLHSLSEGYRLISRSMTRLMIGFCVSVFSTKLLLNRCIVYIQSSMPLSPYLNWIVVCLSKPNDVNHASSSRAQSNLGSLLYPSLMTADIVLCRPTYLCVGSDQIKHIEYANTIITKFNKLFRLRILEDDYEFVIRPQRLLRVLKVMSFKDPYKKMSKSNNDSSISILDSYLNIRTKVYSFKDNYMIIESNELCNHPGVFNLISIYFLCTETNNHVLLSVIKPISIVVLKSLLTKLIYYKMYRIRKKTIRYLRMSGLLDKIVASGKD